MSLFEVFQWNSSVIFLMLFGLWVISLFLRDASIIDLFWGTGFVIIAWLTCYQTGFRSAQSLLLLAIVTLWGIRLSGYLYLRNAGKLEDFRYQAMREKYGRHFPWVSLIIVFALQGVVMLLVSLPVQAGMLENNQANFNALHIAGILFWLVGFLMESIGDYQLSRFKANPENQGKVMDRGLWRYTRHPNYFGDFLVWWGIYLVSFGQGTYWWTVIGPVMMSVFLMRISGVTLLEKTLKNSKPGYEEYMKKTSPFFPMPVSGKSSNQDS